MTGRRVPLLAREQQHRRALRYPIDVAAKVRSEDGAIFVGKTVDINAYGALIELPADALPPVQTAIDLSLSVPGAGGPLTFPGRVTRAGGQQIAAQFDDPPKVVRQAFTSVITLAYPHSIQAARLRSLPTEDPQSPTVGKLSVVVPMYNEEAVAERFHAALREALAELGVAHEIIYVDDGSSDHTLAILEKLSADSPTVRVLALSRNFGHQAAVFAGLQASSGVAVITMDGDMQHPPSLIKDLVSHWKRGIDVVHTVRRAAQDQGWFKRTTSRAFYSLFASLSPVQLPAGTADFRLLDRYVVDVVLSLPERSLFLRGIAHWIGFGDAFVEYDAPVRGGGVSKFTVRKMMTLALDGIIAFSAAPLRLAFVFSVLAVLVTGALLGVIAEAWIGHSQVRGWSSLLAAISLSSGTQLFVLGIIAEYVGRIFAETKARPRYLVKTATGDEDIVFAALQELSTAPRD